jgi:glyoxylase-like metal-dependent hydrolase (beta-lactamase superfamily II)
MFPNAEFLVQKTELEHARNPIPPMKFAYSDEILETLEDLDLTVLDGGFRLRDGIDLIPTPGHAPGQQSVIIETAIEPHAIISDLAYCRHNLEPGISSMLDGHGDSIEVTPLEQEYHPPGIHTDIEACYRSIDLLTERVGENGVFLGAHFGEAIGNDYPE